MMEDALSLIKNSKQALQFLHISPDEDSIGSNLAFKKVAENLSDCRIDIISEDNIKEELGYLPSVSEIKKEDLGKYDYSQYDLFILLDISSLDRLSKNPHVTLPEGAKILVIDHHATNQGFGKVNIIEPNIGSTAELLFKVFQNWNVELNAEVATLLLLGIAGDTGTFQYPSAVTAETFKTASELIKAGADFKEITFNMHQNIPIGTFKLWSFIFDHMQQGQVRGKKYIWSGVDFENHQKLQAWQFESPSSRFFASIKDTDFGFMLMEEDKGFIKGSFRSRTDVDVSEIAAALGGGGHKVAAGFRLILNGKSYEEGVQEIINKVHEVLENV